MCKLKYLKNSKLIIMILAVILVVGMLPMKALATEKSVVSEKTAVQNLEVKSTKSGNCLVTFDPDDGKAGYNDFFKVTVPIGSLVTEKPADPIREGYIFKGWYAYLDENDAPVMWKFEKDTVEENTTLWAAWEKACIVAFDPDDGKAGYNDFFKVTVPIGSLVTEKPADPIREGYIFKGWYAYLDENDAPVMWKFEKDTVEENTTLWAAWEEYKDPGENSENSSSENSNGNESSGNNSSENSNGNESSGNNSSENSSGNENSSNNSSEVVNKEKPVESNNNNNITKTGDTGVVNIFIWVIFNISALAVITLIVLNKKKSAN